MNERIEEQPYDARHNTPPVNPFLFEPMSVEEIKGEMDKHRIEVAAPSTEWSGFGLQWVAGPNRRLVDIGRAFDVPDALDNMHSVDLRTILAHLDSAATAIQNELNARHGMGRPIR